MAAHEELLTRSLWNLLSREGPQILAKRAIYGQLLANYPTSRGTEIFAERLVGTESLAWPPPHSLNPDLALLSTETTKGSEQILAVIEVKVWANANGTLRTSADLLDKHENDAVSEQIYARVSDPDWPWVKNEQPAMSQIDVYRSRKWWKPADKVDMDDPNDVVWLLFDVRGRTAESAFVDSVRPDVWLTIDLPQFARDLHALRMRNQATLSRSDNDIIAAATWLIGQWKKWASVGELSENLLAKDEPQLLDEAD